jgi:glycosyltransferase involved in cell wall biosynthesis
MVHEVNYPFEWHPKSALMFLSHVIMMYLLLISSEKIFVSTEYFRHQLISKFLWPESKVFRLAVGSNISLVPEVKKVTSGKLRFAMFGKLHPAKEVPWLLKTCLHMHRQGLPFDLVYIGESEVELLKTFSEAEKKQVREFLIPKGFLSDTEVSRELQQCDLFLSYFSDGLSSRRGSVMAALQNGIEVISSIGPFTDQELKDLPFIHLFTLDKKQFQQKLIAFIANYHRRSLRAQILNFYQDHFSWQKLVNNYLEISGASFKEF